MKKRGLLVGAVAVLLVIILVAVPTVPSISVESSGILSIGIEQGTTSAQEEPGEVLDSSKAEITITATPDYVVAEQEREK